MRLDGFGHSEATSSRPTSRRRICCVRGKPSIIQSYRSRTSSSFAVMSACTSQYLRCAVGSGVGLGVGTGVGDGVAAAAAMVLQELTMLLMILVRRLVYMEDKNKEKEKKRMNG